MSTRTTLIISITMIIIAVLAGGLLWNKLPDQIASHWNANDRVDDTMPKFWGVLMMPLVTLGMLALFLVIPSIDPLKANIAQFRETFNTFIVLIIAFMLYVHGLTLAWGLGYQNFKMSTAMLPFVGVLFIFIGVLMQKAKRNFFIGIRTPWTLSSDRVWDETHRIGSILFIVSGVLALIGAIFGGVVSFWLMIVPVMGSALFIVVYSYVLYQRETKS